MSFLSKFAHKTGDASGETPQASEEEFAALRDYAVSLVADGVLSDEDVDALAEAVDRQDEHARLTDKQREEILDAVSRGIVENDPSKVSGLAKILGIVSLVLALATIAVAVLGLCSAVISKSTVAVNYQGSNVELILLILQLAMFAIGTILHLLLGVRLVKGKRYGAAWMATGLVAVGVVDMFLESMLTGASLNLLFATILTAFRIAFSVYLSPSLARERNLAHIMRRADTRFRAQSGTLGLDLDGKGYIRLDFFNIFWIFVICSILGLIVEVIFHMVVVDPGVYENRPGLLFGPFSPIYGVGACLMTIATNRFHKAGLIPVFIVCTIIGGAFEWLVSWWMEVCFGVIAWDYSNEFLNIGGRTCLWFASMFGMLGLWWCKWALPRVLKLINRIPWKARYAVTGICAVLMLFNIGMTLLAMDCWQQRVNGEPIVTSVQQFYADNYDNDTMQSIFQNMTMRPQNT